MRPRSATPMRHENSAKEGSPYLPLAGGSRNGEVQQRKRTALEASPSIYALAPGRIGMRRQPRGDGSQYEMDRHGLKDRRERSSFVSRTGDFKPVQDASVRPSKFVSVSTSCVAICFTNWRI